MTDIMFYHLTSTSLDQALPKLLEKSLAAGFTSVVRVAAEAEAERINSLLWTYTTDAFLPHATAKDGYSDQQPIYITAADENPANATLLAITDGSVIPEGAGYKRVLDIFNGSDDAALTAARMRWKAYGTGGHQLSYIKQNDAGGWEKQGS